jgi:hypothetical protein
VVLYKCITIQKTKAIQGGDMMEKSELTKKQIKARENIQDKLLRDLYESEKVLKPKKK